MTTYQFNEETMFADITDGIAIIINNETGIYYGLNGFGTAVFEQMQQGASKEGILVALKNLQGAPADIEQRLNDFVSALLKNKVFTEGEGAGTEATLDNAVAQNDNFELAFNEYTDAQEMLLADPVHEVKEETGWTPEKDSIGYTKEETREREKKMEQ